MISAQSRAKQGNRKGLQSPPKPGVLVSSKSRSWILALAFVFATIAVYYPVSHHPFVNYDDDVYVTGNAHVQSGLNWDTVKWAFTTYEFVNWHPLTWVSHALDYQMFQLDPGGHHETSVALHVLNTLLLFWVLLRATGAPVLAWWWPRCLRFIHQRRIRGLDFGTQEPAEHPVFPARVGRLPLVCARASRDTLGRGRGIIRARLNG